LKTVRKTLEKNVCCSQRSHDVYQNKQTKTLKPKQNKTKKNLKWRSSRKKAEGKRTLEIKVITHVPEESKI
jgi:hypothetical protein